MKVQIICQICKEHIANADTDALALPLKGEMFESKDPVHGFPPPFEDGAEWEYMECPWGPHRPFIEPNKVLTDQGLIILVRGTSVVATPDLTHQARNFPPVDVPLPSPPAEEVEEPLVSPELIVPSDGICNQTVPSDEAVYSCQCFTCGREFYSGIDQDETCPECRAGKAPEEKDEPSIFELEKEFKDSEEGEEAKNEEPAPAGFYCDHPDCTGRGPFKSQNALYGHLRVHKKKGSDNGEV